MSRSTYAFLALIGLTAAAALAQPPAVITNGSFEEVAKDGVRRGGSPCRSSAAARPRTA
jgi:hypothetical protein